MQPSFFQLQKEEELKIAPQYSSDLFGMTEFTNRPILDYPYLRGGEIAVGKENKVFKFKEDKGLWLGNQKFNNAPFRVDMTGKLSATGIDISGRLIAGTGSQVDWSYIQNILVQRAHIADLAVNNAKIEDLAVNNAKIANDLSADKITTGFLSADRIASGSIESTKLGTTVISGGKIVTSLLTADNIQAGTLTGRTVRTSESGTRVELNTPEHPSFPARIVFINLNNEAMGTIRGGANFTICEGTWLFPSGDDIKAGVVWEGSFGHRAFEVWDTSLRTRHLRPLDTSSDIGLSTAKYRNLYLSGNVDTTGNINATGNVDVGGNIYVDGIIYTPISQGNIRDVIPIDDNVWDCGYTGLKWYRVFRYNEVSCDLPTSNCGIKVFKKIERPEVKRGDYGKRHYFKEDLFPDEMKLQPRPEKDPPGTKPMIEMTRTLGVTVQTVRELIEKVEELEKKIKEIKLAK